MDQKTHTFDKSILKAYDIRGVVGKTISDIDAYFMGKSYGTFLVGKGKKLCIVGYDGRYSSKNLTANFIKGLLETGVNAIDIGLAMSPMVYWGMYFLNCDCGMIITASHNPPEYNGFKMLTNDNPVWGEDIQEIGRIAQSGKFATGKGTAQEKNIKAEYIKFVLSKLQLNKDSKIFNIVFDAGSGVVADVINDVVKQIPGKHKVLLGKVDPSFPVHHPDPSLSENMQLIKNEVMGGDYEFGIAYDGDGDRLGIVDKEGYIFFGDELLDVLMRDFLAKNPGEKVMFEISSSQALVIDIKKFGGVPVMWKPGHSTFKSKMKSDNIKIAGETSGHMYYGENYNFDDSLVASMKLINFLANSKQSLVDIRKSFPKTFLTKKVKIKTPDDFIKYKAPEIISKRMKAAGREVIDIDGARVYMNENDWWLIRASNTEPAMTARCEAMTEDGLKKCIAELREQLKMEGFEVNFD